MDMDKKQDFEWFCEPIYLQSKNLYICFYKHKISLEGAPGTDNV
jgi:hypothetical protein